MTSGSLRILWESGETAQVSITGTAGTWSVGGNPITFPYDMSVSTTFDAPRQGRYTLSVELFGVEIAGTPDGTLDFEVVDSSRQTVAPTIDNTPASNDFLGKVDDLTSGLIESGTSATAASLLASYVRFLDQNGDPLPAGSVTTIFVNTVTGDIDDITFEEA